MQDALQELFCKNGAKPPGFLPGVNPASFRASGK
jgi:hypothetical protein